MSRWEDPLRDLVSLRERMNRLFEESLRGQRADNEEVRGALWQPPVDVYERDSEIIVQVEIAGVERDDISVDLEQDRLSIRGERRLSDGLERDHYHRIERAHGAFARSFDLPPSVDQSAITAEYRNGVLTIRMPKRSDDRAGQVKIHVG